MRVSDKQALFTVYELRWVCSTTCWDAEAGPVDAPSLHLCPTTIERDRLRAEIASLKSKLAAVREAVGGGDE